MVASSFMLRQLGATTAPPDAEPEMTGFSVSRPHFVVLGRGLEKVEVWAVPAAAPGSGHVLLGQATLLTSTSTLQTWVLPIPADPVRASQIFAHGFGKHDKDVGVIFLPYVSPADLEDALWGPQLSTANATLARTVMTAPAY